jgi:hypothetical protein
VDKASSKTSYPLLYPVHIGKNNVAVIRLVDFNKFVNLAKVTENKALLFLDRVPLKYALKNFRLYGFRPSAQIALQ